MVTSSSSQEREETEKNNGTNIIDTNSEDEDESIKIPDIPAINNSILGNSSSSTRPEKDPLNNNNNIYNNNYKNNNNNIYYSNYNNNNNNDNDNKCTINESSIQQKGDEPDKNNKDDKNTKVDLDTPDEDDEGGGNDWEDGEDERDTKRVKISKDDNDGEKDLPDDTNNTNNTNESENDDAKRHPIPDGFLRACIDRPGSRPSEEWSCEIKFSAKEDGSKLKNVNILKQVGKRTEKFSKHGRKHVSIYFCEEQYPSSDGFNSGAFAKLFKDVQQASASQGIQLIRNGRYRWMGKQAMKICCTRALCYRPTPNRRMTASGMEKTSTATATSWLQHPEANKTPIQTRKSSTKRAFSLDKKCKFFFLIYFDENGFFVVPGSGNSTHCNHPKAVEEDIEEEKKRKRLTNNNLVDTIPYSNWLPSFSISPNSATKFGLPSKTPDIHFHCPDGTIIHAHKLILAAASDYFKSLFYDESRKWEKEHPKNIWKVDFTSEQMQMFILYMYTGELTPKLLEKQPHTILPVVYEFKLTKIVNAIEEILMKNIDIKSVKQVLISAAKHDLPALKLYCFQFIRYNMAKILTDKTFITLVSEHVDIWDDMTNFLLN